MISLLVFEHVECDHVKPGTFDETHYRCLDGKCLRLYWVCDTNRDNCKEGDDDEIHCCSLKRNERNGTHIGCGYTICFPDSAICDGNRDCFSGVDEENCENQV
ncbi:CD320 antigen-like isoform X2 [Convolutriloba macropyga]|uniref:CD320 antigen-like isoform X2 n=1 Tax=Convolutriloba macropyga TaxID=536237 RepID=UPI003F51DFE4